MTFEGLPEIVRRRAELAGAPGLRWLEALRDLVDDLCARWRLEPGPVIEGGSEALLLAVTLENEREAVLKIPLSEEVHASVELEVLRRAQGRGYAAVLQWHTAGSQQAWLMERLGESLATTGLAPRRQLEHMAAALRRAWTTLDKAEDRALFLRGDAKARGLADYIAQGRSTLLQLTDRATIARALEYAELRGRAFDPARAVLGHGDPHPGNALRDPATSAFKWVDPDGLWIEPAYDLGVMMREWSVEELEGEPVRCAQTWCRALSTQCQTDAEAIWQWAMIERVSTSLALAELEMQDEALAMLKVARAWAR